MKVKNIVYEQNGNISKGIENLKGNSGDEKCNNWSETLIVGVNCFYKKAKIKTENLIIGQIKLSGLRSRKEKERIKSNEKSLGDLWITSAWLHRHLEIQGKKRRQRYIKNI